MLAVSTSPDTANGDWAEMVWDDGRRDNVLVSARERAHVGNIRIELGLVRQWTLEECCRESAGLMDVKRFGAMEEDDMNFAVYDLICFEHHTTLGAWKLWCAVLSRWCVVILVDTLFADMPFVRCE